MSENRKYADRAQYRIMAVARRRKMIKEMSLKYLGGKCQICGYSKCRQALDFHHKNERIKYFGIGEKGYTRAWSKVKKELDNCYLLCANCHREEHTGIMQLSQETEIEKQG